MYSEGIRGILVLNKIDRLITELRLTPMDAFTHLSQIIDQVNATLHSFIQEKFNLAQDEEVELQGKDKVMSLVIVNKNKHIERQRSRRGGEQVVLLTREG